MRKRGARELRPPPARLREVCPLAVKIRAAWRASGRCAHLFFVVGMTSRPASPLSPCPPPSFKTRKNVASSRFRRDATPSLAPSLPPSAAPSRPKCHAGNLFSFFQPFFSARPAFPSKSYHKRFLPPRRARDSWSVAHSPHAYLPPFEKVGVLDRLKMVISKSGCLSEFHI